MLDLASVPFALLDDDTFFAGALTALSRAITDLVASGFETWPNA